MATAAVETVYINQFTEPIDFNEWQKQLGVASKPMLEFMNKYPGSIIIEYEITEIPIKTGKYILNVDINKLEMQKVIFKSSETPTHPTL